MRTYITAGALCCLTYVAAAAGNDLVCRPAAALSADLAAHRTTSQALVALYTARIGKLNPLVHAVIGLNPRAADAARAADARRADGKPRGRSEERRGGKDCIYRLWAYH